MVQGPATERGVHERVDAGTAIVAGGGALFLLSCALPWYGRSLTTASSASTLSLAGRVTASGPGWIVVAGLFVATALVTVGRSRAAVLGSIVCCALLVAGVVVLVRAFPTIPVPADLARPSQPLVSHSDTKLLGAALAVLATAVAAVGVVVHAVTCARSWRAADGDTAARP